MGCFDIWCLLCGNPCHGMLKDADKVFMENIQEYKEYKGNTDYMDPGYEFYRKFKENSVKKIKEMIKKTKWMDKCTFLTSTNDVIHGCVEVSCNNEFLKNSKSYYHTTEGIGYNGYMPSGVFVHDVCWKFIKNTYNIELKYSDLPIVEPSFDKAITHIGYGSIETYWDQEFNFLKVIMDRNEKLCENPPANIKTIFKLLKIRKGRSGPNVSASFYENGTIKIGEDKKLWIKKGNKWVKLSGKLVTENVKYTDKQLFGIPFIGEYNMEPKFIQSINVDGNKYNVKMIMIENI